MVTDKNKEQFEKWFIEFQKLHEYMNINYFLQIKFEMQIGVYLAYYDSIDKFISIDSSIGSDCWHWWINGEQFTFKVEETRPEAHKEAFKKANELVNNNK